MKYVLFIMLFVAPPGQKDPKWTLQSTNSMEFASPEACDAAAKEIGKALENVSSVNLAAWCFDQLTPKKPETTSPSALKDIVPRFKGKQQPFTKQGVAPFDQPYSPPSSGTPSQVKLHEK